ncbi:unnamed protein product [Oppiella nova]|uniref:Large ribosomal subunit protein bL34m n=1 Tax=Oppiella nova TaxID=334625 RepID=A0A7R9MV62_9ACAR|nr:unnamed protein product [Oppiella nova]CAG2184168.1 unnamed protein product [Oppiella nova]
MSLLANGWTRVAQLVLRSGHPGQCGQCVQLGGVRHNVRWFFEKPSEVKRIRKHGWIARISTQKGRNIVMRRILRGRHVLTH